jgi:hypothetical protein
MFQAFVFQMVGRFIGPRCQRLLSAAGGIRELPVFLAAGDVPAPNI